MSLMNNTDIPPNYGGTISEPNINDVLSGRGGRINAHPGNVQFRELVKQNRDTYLSKDTKKLDKAKIASKIVEIVRNMDPPGRFLKQGDDGSWSEIGDERARKKAGQAMREKDDSNKVHEDSSIYGDNLSRNVSRNNSAEHSTLPPFHYPNANMNVNVSSPMNQYEYTHFNNMNDHHHFRQHQMTPTGAGIGTPTNNHNFNLQNRDVHDDMSNLEPIPSNVALYDRAVSQLSNASTVNSNNNPMHYPMDSSLTLSSIMPNISQQQQHHSNHHPRDVFQNNNNHHYNSNTRPQSIETRNISNASHDSWGSQSHNMNDSQSLFHTSTGSMESERRKQFRKMKFEQSCLPAPSLQFTSSSSATTTTTNNSHNNPNNDTQHNNLNDLMQESLMSLEMRSMEMKKSTTFQDKSMTSMMKLDSVGEMIAEAFDSDVGFDSGNNIGITSPSISSSKLPNKGGGSSSGKQDRDWSIDDSNRASDKSTQSASMLFDISQSLTMLDLADP